MIYMKDMKKNIYKEPKEVVDADTLLDINEETQRYLITMCENGK